MNQSERGIVLDDFANALFAGSLVALIVVDNDGRIVLANPAAAELFGYSSKELTGLGIEELIPEKQRNHHAKLRKDFQAAPEPRQMGAGRILHGRHQSGSQIPVEVGLTPISFDGQQWTMATIVNLSERNSHEAELERIVRENQLILDSLPAHVFFKDLNNRVLRVNKTVAESLGLPRDQVEGKHSRELYPKDWERFHEDDLNVVSSGQPRTAYVQPIADRWMQTDKVPLKNTEGQFDRILVVASDITELKQAIDAERTLRNQLQKTGEIAKVGGWEYVIGSDGGPIWSQEVCRIHEVADDYQPSLAEAINFYAPEFRATIQEVVRNGIEKHEPWDVECKIQTAKGNLRHVRAVGEPEIVDGKCVRLWGTLQDITEQHEAAKRLELAQQTIDKLGDAVFFILQDGSISYANEQASKSLGYSADELCKMSITDIDLQLTEQTWRQHWSQVQSKGLLIYESKQRRKDGSQLDCETREHFMEFDGRPLLVALVRDMTAVNVAKRDLQRAKFSVDHSHDAIYWVLEDGSFFYANNAACEMLGYPREQLLNLSVSDIDPSYPPPVWAEHWQRMKQDRYMRLETKHTGSGGDHRWVEMNIHFYTYENEEFIVGTARDITFCQRNAAFLSRKRRALQLADQKCQPRLVGLERFHKRSDLWPTNQNPTRLPSRRRMEHV